MPDRLRRLDLHARQLQLSEMLDPASRSFQAAFQLAQLEARAEVDALVAGAAFGDRVAERLFRRHLLSYFAAALLMPYGRFLRACERTGYDLDLLQRRFNVGFEMLAHRLTTLSRVGARGLPFFMLRIDRAGQASKRYAGASAAPLVEAPARCPLVAPPPRLRSPRRADPPAGRAGGWRPLVHPRPHRPARRRARRAGSAPNCDRHRRRRRSRRAADRFARARSQGRPGDADRPRLPPLHPRSTAPSAPRRPPAAR